MEKPVAEKKTHAAVGYENPSQHLPDRCFACQHFIMGDPPRCDGVKDPISPRGWCKRFKAKPSDYRELFTRRKETAARTKSGNTDAA